MTSRERASFQRRRRPNVASRGVGESHAADVSCAATTARTERLVDLLTAVLEEAGPVAEERPAEIFRDDALRGESGDRHISM